MWDLSIAHMRSRDMAIVSTKQAQDRLFWSDLTSDKDWIHVQWTAKLYLACDQVYILHDVP